MTSAPRSRPSGRSLLFLQTLLCAAAVLALALPAGAGDTVLLVPLTADASATLPARALDGHTRLIGAGVLPGSLVVRDSRWGAARWAARGVLAVAVPLSACAGRRAPA